VSFPKRFIFWDFSGTKLQNFLGLSGLSKKSEFANLGREDEQKNASHLGRVLSLDTAEIKNLQTYGILG
jgi:hypothetical protein